MYIPLTLQKIFSLISSQFTRCYVISKCKSIIGFLCYVVLEDIVLLKTSKQVHQSPHQCVQDHQGPETHYEFVYFILDPGLIIFVQFYVVILYLPIIKPPNFSITLIILIIILIHLFFKCLG